MLGFKSSAFQSRIAAFQQSIRLEREGEAKAKNGNGETPEM